MVTPRKLNPTQRGRKSANKVPMFVMSREEMTARLEQIDQMPRRADRLNAFRAMTSAEQELAHEILTHDGEGND
jgi:hypothetical protein